MEVILLDKIGRLGGLGDKVKVKGGFARNYLIPEGKAVMATKENIKKFDERRAEFEAKVAQELADAQARGQKLTELASVEISSRLAMRASCSALSAPRTSLMRLPLQALQFTRARSASAPAYSVL